MEACWEYLGCRKRACVMYGRRDRIDCWAVEDTLCNNPTLELLKRKMPLPKEEMCLRSWCLYYQYAHMQGKV